MVVSLNTGQRVLTGRLFVTVAGIPTQVTAVDTQHGVDQLIGTATIEIPLPRPAHVVLNARLNVQAGFDETSVNTVFSGRISDGVGTLDDSGQTKRFRAQGWASLLNFGDPKDLVYDGSSSLYGIFRSLCNRRGVPRYMADLVTYPDGATGVRFGGNSYIDDGDVIIPRDSSPLTWLDQRARLFGYRIFDTPSGFIRLMRVSGLPPGSAVGTYTEGVNAYRYQRSDDLKPMVTYWEIKGATWTDSDGVRNAVRSIPASVPYSAQLDPPGYRKQTLPDSSLVNQSLADACRNVQEIDYSAPYETETWDIHVDTARQPGDVVAITTPTLDLPTPANRWLMSLTQSFSDSGNLVTMTGWAGAGSALPAGNDATTVTVGTGPYHLGDETIPWYAVPAPSGKQYTIPITVPDVYTAIVLTGKAHGCNSYFIDNKNTDSTVSKIEIWQNGAKVGSTDLPTMNENYALQLDYTNIANWTAIRLPIDGNLKVGAAEVRVIAGEEKSATGGPIDDLELRDLQLTLTGVGQPTLPGEM